MATKSRKSSKRPTAPKSRGQRVTRKDFDKVKPSKLVPGVAGRSAWFTARAGDKPDALSSERLFCALECAAAMRGVAEMRVDIAEQAQGVLRQTGLFRGRQGTRPVLVESDGRRVSVVVKRPRQPTGLSALSDPLEVPELRTGLATLYVPVEANRAGLLDLQQLVVADIADRANPRLNESFSYLPQDDVIVGQVDRAGLYQVFAIPINPWLQASYDALCRLWKWVESDPTIAKLAGDGPRPEHGIVDRICQLILCAPDYLAVQDPQVFERMGVGPPPGGTGSDIENMCDKCSGDFFGELEIGGDLIPIPPIVKWRCQKRSECSRWESIGPAPDADFRGIGRVSQIDVHPSKSNQLIAGAAGGGVWRSMNGGDSWHPLMQLEPTLTIGAVAIAPSNPNVIYAASGEDGGGWNPAWSGAGIYRSHDNGSTWTLLTPVPSTRFSALVIDPRGADVVYAAGNAGLHKSTDGGMTWLTNPGNLSLLDGQITDLVLAHDTPSRIYVGVRNNGVFRSSTGGEQTGATPAFTRLDGSDQLPSVAAAGWIKLAIGRNGSGGSNFLAAKLGANGSRLFTSGDGGDTWTERAADVATVTFDEWCSVIAIDPDDHDVLYAGAAAALLRTTNGGSNPADWVSINAGVHPDQQDIAFDPSDSARIYLGNDGGVYRSDDRGTSWTFASGNLHITQFYDIDISERDRHVIAGGAQDNGIYYRNASGQWANIPWGDGTQVAIDPTDPAIFYFSSQNGLADGLRKSVDAGASHQPLGRAGLSGGSPWITIIKLEPRDPIADPAANRVLFVCGTNQLFRSTNGGRTWVRVEDASGNPFTPVGNISALEFAPSDPNILYLATSNGALYRATAGGINASDWGRIDTVGSDAEALFPNVQIQAIRVHPRNPDQVWLVFGGAGVSFLGRPNRILNPFGISHLFRTADGGANWQDASGRFVAISLPDVPTSAVALHDFDPDIAYVGTDVGVFRTADGGDTWAAFQDGLPRSPVIELRLNRRFEQLYAATMGRGIYVRDV